MIALLLAAGISVAVDAPAVAPVPVPGAVSQTLSVEIIKRQLDEVGASSVLDEATRNKLSELYRNTIANLLTREIYLEATERFRLAIDTSPREAADLRTKLDAKLTDGDRPLVETAGLTLAELEQHLQREKATLAADEAASAEVKRDFSSAQERPGVIRQRIAEAKIELARLESEASPRTSSEDLAKLVQARRWSKQAKQELLRTEILMLEQELASLPMRLDLMRVQLDLLEFEQQHTATRVLALERAANDLRAAETQQVKLEAEAVERAAASKHPLVAELAARNARLSGEVDVLADAIEVIEQDERKAAEEVKRLEEAYRSTRQKIDVAGLGPILGQLLQEQRRILPETAIFKKIARDLEKKIAQTSLSQLLLEEERRQLRSIPDYVASLTESLPEHTRQEIVAELTPLATSRQLLVDRALSIQRAYLRSIGELEFVQQRLADVVTQFDTFLDRRLLWVRSTQTVGLETMRRIPGQVASLLVADQWQDVLRTLGHEATSGGWIGLAVLIAILLRINRSRLLRALAESGRNVGIIDRDRLQDTTRGILIIALVSIGPSLVMLAVGRELNTSLVATDFTKVVGRALLVVAPLLFQLQALRVFVAPGSVAGVHFKWREAGLERLHRDIGWFMPALIVTTMLTILALNTTAHAWGAGLGRAFFVLLMAMIAVFFYRLSRPGSGTLGIMLEQHTDSQALRLSFVWFAILAGAPLVAAVVALSGFMYTAGTVISHILDTAWFALLVLIIHQMIVRWLVLNQRKLRLQALRAKRQADQEARDAKGASVKGDSELIYEVEEPKVDFKALDASSRKLTNNAMLLIGIVGVWLIWEDMFPALGVLDDITLWTYTKSGIEGEIPITLSSIGVAVLILLVMIVSTRQLPAFMEIVLLQRMQMTQGGRYTVLTLTKYTIVAVGVAWIFGVLGGSWSEIQWVFAALGVGIGFGLQEIVANFISGLIILFERPIRVGDVVTVGNVDGVVTRIRIRATTIRNWDRKELLVPNKNFITQELLNWSLSDQVTRIVINIGVAYATDVERTISIIEQVAADHERVLKDPPPVVIFEGFGDNALQLSLRCFIGDIDHRLIITTELNLAINRAMNEAGIEIAFPQQDVHLESREPLVVRVLRDRDDPVS